MMECQLCNNQDGPWEFADVYDDGKAKVMLICEDCAKQLKKLSKKREKEKKKIKINPYEEWRMTI